MKNNYQEKARELVNEAYEDFHQRSVLIEDAIQVRITTALQQAHEAGRSEGVRDGLFILIHEDWTCPLKKGPWPNTTEGQKQFDAAVHEALDIYSVANLTLITVTGLGDINPMSIREWQIEGESKKAVLAAEPTPTPEQSSVVQLQARVRELTEALDLILPMAKGYAHANQVGSNTKYVDAAQTALAGKGGE